MMGDFQFDRATALVYDPVAANRIVTRSALHTLGFRGVHSAASMAELTSVLAAEECDLVICETTAEDLEIERVLQRVRFGDLGVNPYIVIIATAWHTSGDLVRRVLNAGCDDLVVRPFSVAQFGQRLRQHIERRKPFVVTADYVGPDRRKEIRPGEASAPSLEVPNMLRAKVATGGERIDLQGVLGEIAATRVRVQRERLKRQAFQIGVLAHFIQDEVAGGADEERICSDAARATALSQEFARRAGEGAFDGVLETVGTLIETLRLVADGRERAKNAALAVQLCLALQARLDPERDPGVHAAEYSATVARIRDRRRKD